MIIFGWGYTKRRNFGPVLKQLCTNCHNETHWHLHRVSIWFTLFFIPVFPYSTTMFLACPVCTSGVELNKNDFERIRPIAEANERFVQGKITEEEHTRLISQKPAPVKPKADGWSKYDEQGRLIEIDPRLS
jgi:hypothetical protein